MQKEDVNEQAYTGNDIFAPHRRQLALAIAKQIEDSQIVQVPQKSEAEKAAEAQRHEVHPAQTEHELLDNGWMYVKYAPGEADAAPHPGIFMKNDLIVAPLYGANMVPYNLWGLYTRLPTQKNQQLLPLKLDIDYALPENARNLCDRLMAIRPMWAAVIMPRAIWDMEEALRLWHIVTQLCQTDLDAGLAQRMVDPTAPPEDPAQPAEIDPVPQAQPASENPA